MLTKEKVINSLNELPDTFSMDELIDKLMLLQKIEAGLEQSKKGEVFSCTNCEDPVKPDVVFFGEPLPYRYRKLIDSDLNQCDLLIVLGTSLRVYPIASILEHIKSTIPVIIMNLHFHLPSGINFTNPHVFLSGDIQETSHTLKKMI